MQMLPLTIEMHDHLRQEKTGYLPSDIPAGSRQQAFQKGTLGLWRRNHFVIYYQDGRVPPGRLGISGSIRAHSSSVRSDG